MKSDRQKAYRLMGMALLGLAVLPLLFLYLDSRRSNRVALHTANSQSDDKRGSALKIGPSNQAGGQPSGQNLQTTGMHPDPKTSVPDIARIFGLKVGYNGRKRLERLFGHGAYSVPDNPDGGEIWRTRKPKTGIYTEGFCRNKEGEVLEEVDWYMESQDHRSTPLAHHITHDSGWMGLVNLGMTKEEVARLTGQRLPPPTIEHGDTWVWNAEGFVRPNSSHTDVYRKWTARLNFDNERLTAIALVCESEQSDLPPRPKQDVTFQGE